MALAMAQGRVMSQSAKTVWIEIHTQYSSIGAVFSSQSAKTVWIEMIVIVFILVIFSSQSAKTVWIEMDRLCHLDLHNMVTVCEDCVD